MTIISELNIKPGVITGDDVRKVLDYAKDHKFALPAINVTSSTTVIACLTAAKAVQCPIIIQISSGGAIFFAGKSLDNTNCAAAVAGSIAAAHYIRSLAPHYGVPVILHSDHCARKIIPWLDGMLDADEEYFKKHKESLFSSHMLDLSEETKEDNINTSYKYLQRCHKINCLLEVEIGITGGEEDGVNNESVNNAALYTQSEDVYDMYKKFKEVTDFFSIAAAFGNVHGVYSPGNVKLHPELLGDHQAYIKQKINSKFDKPVYFVFHGGSGSTSDEIAAAINNGVIKMNIDTDTQWAFTVGLRNYFNEKAEYLKTQVGNPEGAHKPNKKYYDPREYMKKAQDTMYERIIEAYKNLQVPFSK